MKIQVLKRRDTGTITATHITWDTAVIKLEQWKKYLHDKFAAYKIYNSEISKWIEEQPIHMWKHDDEGSGNCYLFTEEMESWFLVRWT